MAEVREQPIAHIEVEEAIVVKNGNSQPCVAKKDDTKGGPEEEVPDKYLISVIFHIKYRHLGGFITNLHI